MAKTARMARAPLTRAPATRVQGRSHKMNALSLTIIRVAFLAVLWLFAIAAIGVVRTDLLGGQSPTARRGKVRQGQAPRQPPPARPSRAGPGSPPRPVV